MARKAATKKLYTVVYATSYGVREANQVEAFNADSAWVENLHRLDARELDALNGITVYELVVKERLFGNAAWRSTVEEAIKERETFDVRRRLREITEDEVERKAIKKRAKELGITAERER